MRKHNLWRLSIRFARQWGRSRNATQKFPGKHKELTWVLKMNIHSHFIFFLITAFGKWILLGMFHFLIWLRKINHWQAYNWNSTYDDHVWRLWTFLREKHVLSSITNGVILENTYLHKEHLSNLPTTTKQIEIHPQTQGTHGTVWNSDCVHLIPSDNEWTSFL